MLFIQQQVHRRDALNMLGFDLKPEVFEKFSSCCSINIVSIVGQHSSVVMAAVQ